MTQAFNLSQLANKTNSNGQLDAATGLYNQTPVANGGTGASSLTANNVLLGNGTSALQTVAPGTANNVLTSNGITWTSSPIPFPIIQTQAILTGSSTWNKPTTGDYQWVKIELWGGGGGGGKHNNRAGGGGGAYNFIVCPLSWLASSESYAVAIGGAGRTTDGNGNVGGTTTFTISNSINGAITLSAFGGGGGGANGSTNVSSGGGGGGALSAGQTGTSGSTQAIGGYGGAFGGGDGRVGTADTTQTVSGGYGGGGGGSSSMAGAPSVYGGGGGGGNTLSGGLSLFAGDGGVGSVAGTTANNGETPSGGGGGCDTGTSGTGGNGKIVLTWW